MGEKLHILDCEMDHMTAKEAMKYFVNAMTTESLCVIDLLSADHLLSLDGMQYLKDAMRSFDLVLPNDKKILREAGCQSNDMLREAQEHTFLKMLFRYLRKHHRNVYLLASSEEELKAFQAYLMERHVGMQICGMSVVERAQSTDLIVNVINGSESECVLSVMGAPMQEEFFLQAFKSMHVSVVLGIDFSCLPGRESTSLMDKLAALFVARIFRRRVAKSKETFGQID